MTPLLSLSLAVVGCVATTGWWRTGRVAFLLGGFPLALAGVIIAGLSPVDAVLRFAHWLTERAIDGRALWILAGDIAREGPAEFRRVRKGLEDTRPTGPDFSHEKITNAGSPANKRKEIWQ